MGHAEELWRNWYGSLKAGSIPQDVLASLTDKDLLTMLATAARDHPEEGNLLLTEALKRLTDARRLARATAGMPPPPPSVEEWRESVDEAAQEIHRSEAAAEERAQLQGKRPTEETLAAHASSLEIERVRAEVEDRAEAEHNHAASAKGTGPLNGDPKRKGSGDA